MTSMIGSRLLTYKLDTIYKRNMTVVINLVKNFSAFDQKFFVSIKRLSIISMKITKRVQK